MVGRDKIYTLRTTYSSSHSSPLPCPSSAPFVQTEMIREEWNCNEDNQTGQRQENIYRLFIIMFYHEFFIHLQKRSFKQSKTGILPYQSYKLGGKSFTWNKFTAFEIYATIIILLCPYLLMKYTISFFSLLTHFNYFFTEEKQMALHSNINFQYAGLDSLLADIFKIPVHLRQKEKHQMIYNLDTTIVFIYKYYFLPLWMHICFKGLSILHCNLSNNKA